MQGQQKSLLKCKRAASPVPSGTALPSHPPSLLQAAPYANQKPELRFSAFKHIPSQGVEAVSSLGGSHVVQQDWFLQHE